MDYAYYMKGLIYFERQANFMERWFNVDLSRRPPVNAKKSFDAFEELVQKYPHSEYAADARQRMIFLRNRLADFELYVAQYYMRRGAYVGALNRAKYCIEQLRRRPGRAGLHEGAGRGLPAARHDRTGDERRKVYADNYPGSADGRADEEILVEAHPLEHRPV